MIQDDYRSIDTIPYHELRAHEVHSFHIRPLRATVAELDDNQPAHRHAFQELMWVKTGSGQHKIDESVIDIVPSTFYLIAQGQVHHFHHGENLEGYLIRFTDDFLLGHTTEAGWDYRVTLLSHFAIHNSLAIQPEEVPLVESMIDRMWYEQNHDNFGQTQAIRHLLQVLLLQLERNRLKLETVIPELTDRAQIYRHFIGQLEDDFRLEHSVEHYASLLHVTGRQLSEITKHFAGKTAKRLIIERLVLEAKRYLQHTNASVKEISHALAFSSPSYFSKVFKQITGMAPHEFKADA